VSAIEDEHDGSLRAQIGEHLGASVLVLQCELRCDRLLGDRRAARAQPTAAAERDRTGEDDEGGASEVPAGERHRPVVRRRRTTVTRRVVTG
jgi:hypothetical protein